MEKIIGGKEWNGAFPVRIRQKILWPCYEFIAQAAGVDDYERNIIEEVILRLADINVTDIKDIASSTGLEEDLISFMQSRLEQHGCLDGCFKITDIGKQRLGEMIENHCSSIHVYVDAVSGDVVPYFSMLDDNDRFNYSFGKEEREDSGRSFFKYKGYSTAGTESDEFEIAYKLQYDKNLNTVPRSEEVTAMLHKLYPGKDGVYARVEEKQNTSKNLRWILMDVFQPEGSSRDWVFTDGFGKVTSFFSVQRIKNDVDKKYIVSLRESVQVRTNANNSSSVSKSVERYSKLKEKLVPVQKCMKELNSFVDSPDKEDKLRSAMVDSVVYLIQLVEWVLFYILHKNSNEYCAKAVLDNNRRMFNSKAFSHIIGSSAFKSAQNLGFDVGLNEKKAFCQKNGKLWNAFEKTPKLLPLLDLLLISLDQESWLKEFASENPDFLCILVDLNEKRNQGMHEGFVGKIEDFPAYVEEAYKEILLLMEKGLNVKVKESSEFSFEEKIALQNERDEAISRMEDALGFSLCHTLNAGLISFIIDMERRGTNAENLNNAIILDQYRILEYLFKSVNECLGDELKNSGWKEKVKRAGFVIPEENEFKTLLKTKEDKISAALNRKNASMNAACIAFCTLADAELLRGISAQWREMLSDICYIAYKRSHGEIPDSIDGKRTLDIKRRIVDLIHYFAENGFLTSNLFKG